MYNFKVAVITVSDRSSKGEREDLGGPMLAELMEENGYLISHKSIVPDELEEIKDEIIKIAGDGEIALIVTTGGTGFAPRDVTPEATIAACERLVPGIPEAMRANSARYTNRAYLSRAQSGIINRSLVINLPGSPKALKENLEAIFPFLEHGLEMLRGKGADCANEIK